MGGLLDFPRCLFMFFVVSPQLRLQTLCACPCVSCFDALRTPFSVGIFFATHLTAWVNAIRAFPGSQLVSIARQFYFTWENFSTVLGFALSVVACLTSLAFRIGAMWSFAVKTSETAS